MTRRNGLALPRSDGRMISRRMSLNRIILILRLQAYEVAVDSDRDPAKIRVPHSGQRGSISPVKLYPHLRQNPLARRDARRYGPRIKAMMGQVEKSKTGAQQGNPSFRVCQ